MIYSTVFDVQWICVLWPKIKPLGYGGFIINYLFCFEDNNEA